MPAQGKAVALLTCLGILRRWSFQSKSGERTAGLSGRECPCGQPGIDPARAGSWGLKWAERPERGRWIGYAAGTWSETCCLASKARTYNWSISLLKMPIPLKFLAFVLTFCVFWRKALPRSRRQFQLRRKESILWRRRGTQRQTQCGTLRWWCLPEIVNLC